MKDELSHRIEIKKLFIHDESLELIVLEIYK